MASKSELKEMLENINDYIDDEGNRLYFSGEGADCEAHLQDEDDLYDNPDLLKALEDGQEVWHCSDNSDSTTVIGRAAAIKWLTDSARYVLEFDLDELLSEERLIEAIKDEIVWISSHNPQLSGWSVFGFGEEQPTIAGSDIYADTYRVNMRVMTVQQAYANYDVPAEELASAWNAHREQQEIDGELKAIMTVKEVAETYHLDESGVRSTCDRGAIPARKSGGTWLIRRVDAEKRWSKHLTTIVFAVWLAGCLAGIGL